MYNKDLPTKWCRKKFTRRTHPECDVLCWYGKVLKFQFQTWVWKLKRPSLVLHEGYWFMCKIYFSGKVFALLNDHPSYNWTSTVIFANSRPISEEVWSRSERSVLQILPSTIFKSREGVPEWICHSSKTNHHSYKRKELWATIWVCSIIFNVFYGTIVTSVI